MSRRYSFHSDQGEQEPLDRVNRQYSPSPNHHHQPYSDQPQQGYYQQHHATDPGAHPDSSYNRLAAPRAAAPSPYQPPQPPPHRDQDGRHWGQDTGYAPSSSQGRRQNTQQSITTPGADNFGEAAAGGMAGIAYTVAERNARESGVNAMRSAQDQSSYPQGYYPEPDDQPSQQPTYPQRAHQDHWQDQPTGRDQNPYNNNYRANPGQYQGYYAQGHGTDTDSSSSLQGLGAAGAAAGYASPGMRTPTRSPHYGGNDVYTDNPYSGYARNQDPNLGRVNPHDIMDDGDDGLHYGDGRRGPRTSMLSLGAISNRSGRSGNSRGNSGAAVGGAGAGAAAGGAALGYVAHGAAKGHGGSSGDYDAVHKLGNSGGGAEKSEWLNQHSSNRNKWKWCIIISIVAVIVAAIVCGILFGVVLRRGGGGGANGGGSSGQSAADDQKSNGDLGLNSDDIKALMNNKNLHKVFPGMDYTPINTQYPECVHNPPSQNNVTRDVAVLSQLTNTIRLYGTDCNQTQMVIHAIRQLKMEKTMKIWMGVWQDKNVTTNARQLTQMWDILNEFGAEPFKGLIVANEILFRQEMTTTELGTLLAAVRTNLTAKSINLPVATSDLGDKLTPELARVSDYVMGNIHPFFAGVNAKDAAAWTMTFWTGKASGFFKTDDKSKNVIAEIGWPTQGGTSCGDAKITSCPNGSHAGIQEANQLLQDWVCPALNNGTNYFWFSAFDEPWKERFNENGRNWEDQWGLMDVNRNLKPGIIIPDCGGKTV